MTAPLKAISTVQISSNSHIIVSCNYYEGAILAIGREASRRGILRKYFCSFESSALVQRIRHMPNFPAKAWVETKLGRRRLLEIEPAATEPVSSGLELIHLLSRQLPYTRWASGRLMLWAKYRFDRQVSRRLPGAPSSMVIALPSAAEATFLACQQVGHTKVLHFVNGHPDEVNRLLVEVGRLPAGHRELMRRKDAAKVRREIDRADVILVPSRLVRDQLMERGVGLEKLLTIPYGVDVDRFHPLDRRGTRSDGLTCLYIGQIAHRKGIRCLLDAARDPASSNITFQLVGPVVSGELLDDLPANVRWVPTLPHEDVARLMRCADMFVLPSIEDSFGLVALEAMASGTPVIVSLNAGASELIRDGEDGLLVPAGDVPSLVAAFQQLSCSPLRRIALGRAARARVARDQSWASYGSRVIDSLAQWMLSR